MNYELCHRTKLQEFKTINCKLELKSQTVYNCLKDRTLEVVNDNSG